MNIRELPLDELVLDPNLNLRDRLDEFTVERYAESWERLPPITVYEVDGRWLVADGFHRHASAIALGRRTIHAEIVTGSFEEALDFVSSVNLFHGLPLTRAERRRAVDVKLRLHHDWSDRRMAEELGVSRELVAKTRRSLIEGNQIPNNPGRVGADGKTYSSAGLPKDPNEHLPKGKSLAQQDDPRDRGGRESDAPPWDDATSPMPAVSREPTGLAPWEDGDAKAVALSDPVPSAAPTIDEMLSLMSKQVMEVINWTQAEGFTEAYRSAGANTRGLFQAAVIKLAARADQLRKL
ncbi:ParB/RepB/Spo0J family partition protein [Singulisphaera acidiphila]|uniref:Putative transcriptional regulator n=1 Tax=Singulisphaera acidiphila (strain ATCC BAA-1392 / DSM 18658 / VKM B-2454 / MOB10) TaxID=886293 RepID=L0DQ29_SINAD|nr:ParB/RepB/Spo0J family partition protein [Singulisphaera acidiphila]AGA30920.1 putative transcriptional regulator [Singulisphaera acidiphila DSM 18658]